MAATDTTALSAAADRRAVLRYLRRPDMQHGNNGVAIFLEPRRKRAHVIIHDGKGNAGQWSSSSMGVEHWRKLRTGVADMADLEPESNVVITPAGHASLAAWKKGGA